MLNIIGAEHRGRTLAEDINYNLFREKYGRAVLMGWVGLGTVATITVWFSFICYVSFECGFMFGY